MPIIVFEKWKSRNGKASVEDPSINIVYGVKGTTDETEVDTAVSAAAPDTWNGLTRQSWTRECLGPTDDGGLWEVVVSYDRKDPQSEGAVQFSCDTLGGHVKITQSRETLLAVGIGGATPPDYKGAIGVTDTSIEGVDILDQKLEITIVAIVAKTELEQDFIASLHAAAPCCNDDTFAFYYQGQYLEFSQRELLFMGHQASYRGNGDWEFHIKLAASKTVQQIEIGSDGPLRGEKKGHDYQWMAYKETKDVTSGGLVRHLKGVYVERVYEERNFYALFQPLNIPQAP